MITKIPVVVILGHIDHGKTSLLDAIRQTSFVKKESGGITQHIGAFDVEIKNKKITFIDTPGHEAFSQMRERGAKVADIAVLVIDAEEGVKTQTVEAINYLKEINIPMVVALNKIDKPNANPEKVKIQLQNYGIFVEGYGGDIPVVETSAKTKKGINELLEVIDLLYQMNEVKVDENKPAKGVIIEVSLDYQMGKKVTLIVEEGILNLKDIVGTQTAYGRVKNIIDWRGTSKNKLLPGESGIVLGFEDLPTLGENFYVFKTLKEVQIFIEENKDKIIQKKSSVKSKMKIKVIIRADFKGSLDVLEELLIKKLSNEDVGFEILESKVGEITENDVKIAKDMNAKIISFRQKLSKNVESLASSLNVEILNFDLIYDFIDNIQKKIKEEIEQKPKEKKEVGKLKVLVVFKTQRKNQKEVKQVFGVKILDGDIQKNDFLIIQKEKEIIQGQIIEIQRDKKEIESAKVGEEIGIEFKGNGKVKIGDEAIVLRLI
ncbi:MAG: GTP-binding protein [Candidatus Pacebacteria bacterium]|nr:GTP-binding protein [Candidatus Paceibacterota bacterium]